MDKSKLVSRILDLSSKLEKRRGAANFVIIRNPWMLSRIAGQVRRTAGSRLMQTLRRVKHGS